MDLIGAIQSTDVTADEGRQLAMQHVDLANQVKASGKGGEFEFYTSLGRRFFFRYDDSGTLIGVFYAKRIFGEG